MTWPVKLCSWSWGFHDDLVAMTSACGLFPFSRILVAKNRAQSWFMLLVLEVRFMQVGVIGSRVAMLVIVLQPRLGLFETVSVPKSM